MNYTDHINSDDEALQDKVSESTIGYLTRQDNAVSKGLYVYSPHHSTRSFQYQRAKDLAERHFDKDFANHLARENYLIDAAMANNDLHEFDDIEEMYAKAEASGSISQSEVNKMFAIWKYEM